MITEQKKGTYKYFIDLGDRMEPVESRTVYMDEVRRRWILILRGLCKPHTVSAARTCSWKLIGHGSCTVWISVRLPNRRRRTISRMGWGCESSRPTTE